ncbi:hypothetical protein PAXRUDRAFT_35764 [Paxillus rubicundulus Ve08.2h10]|uniref:Uncharacterized protein n=1 Tax=Paxillus rubicundulus Ve08.2h10 TaxID=930991 RepID=A0A0D0D199_9AGAM|nr:hypothetical protein PAXRUDRAFT_35764 [Paxillus rubicundulus Ve08.2h10]
MLTHPGIPHHCLNLKLNAICAIQCNITIDKGLIHLMNDNQMQCIPSITFTLSPPHSYWNVNHKQFLLQLAYATTFNGCQGLTLSQTAIDLCTDPFAHDSLVIFAPSNANHDCANIVYPNLLLCNCNV